MIQIGDIFGELTVEALLPTDDGGNRRWLCRCDCGNEAIRTTAALNRSRADSQKPCCARCLEELRRGMWIQREIHGVSYLKNLWLDRGELWTTVTLERLERDIHDEVGLELGGWQESLLSVQGEPWDYLDTERPVDDPSMTREEIGKRIERENVKMTGISREWIRQIEAGALRKLQNNTILKRFHEAGIPAGVAGLDVALDSGSDPEPEVRVASTTLDKVLAVAIQNKKNAQRPAWCPAGYDNIAHISEKETAYLRREHMALIDKAIVRAHELVRIRNEFVKSKHYPTGQWWLGIPETMLPPITPLSEIFPPSTPPPPYPYRWAWRHPSSTHGHHWPWKAPTAEGLKSLYYVPVPPILPDLPKPFAGLRSWIDRQVKERS